MSPKAFPKDFGRLFYLESSELALHVLQLSKAAQRHEEENVWFALALQSV